MQFVKLELFDMISPSVLECKQRKSSHSIKLSPSLKWLPPLAIGLTFLLKVGAHSDLVCRAAALLDIDRLDELSEPVIMRPKRSVIEYVVASSQVWRSLRAEFLGTPSRHTEVPLAPLSTKLIVHHEVTHEQRVRRRSSVAYSAAGLLRVACYVCIVETPLG